MSFHHRQSTEAEIEDAVDAILSVMPAPRGMDGIKLVQGYLTALKGFPASAIREAVEGFLSGRFSDDFSSKFCPTPPDLATMVRRCLHAPRPIAVEGRKFSFKAPNSKRLEQGVTKDEARRLVAQGLYPKGSIWLPGESGNNPAFGDLYGPDDHWARPEPVDRPADDGDSPRDVRMTNDERRHCIEKLKDAFQVAPPSERGGFFARDHSLAIGRWLNDCRRAAQESQP